MADAVSRTEVMERLREKAGSLPLKPGVYLMKDRTGDVIYVGKAVKLKNRVSSYFHGAHNAKTEAMVAKVEDFDVIVASSEFEALVLENSLIKHHMPHYNILLKDDKGYPFIRVDMREPYPSFSVVNRMGNDGADYYGPYGGRGTTFRAIDAVSKALKLPTCGKKFPRDIGKSRPCLNYHMGACRGYCLEDAPQEEYRAGMEAAVRMLGGKTDELVKELTEQMETDAAELRFELAAEKRDRIRAITALKSTQRVVAGGFADTDAVGLYLGTAKSCFSVLHYIGGDLLDKDYEIIPTPMEDRPEALAALLAGYYQRRGSVPRSILLPCRPAGMEALEQLLNGIGKTKLSVPRRGEMARLAETAEVNAAEEAERVSTREEKQLKVLEWLRDALRLPALPERIEAFDISNTGNDNIVAGMTVFVHARPKKGEYRRFRMKTVSGQDDYGSMREAVGRRFRRFLDGDAHFGDLPDLLLIDGGAVHAAAASDVLRDLGISVPVFGMVKDDRHRTRALTAPDGGEIGISANPGVFSFIGTIQEETHRCAIEYQRSLQRGGTSYSELDRIRGVGLKRKQALLKAFGSLKAIAAADREKLEEVVDKRTAEAVFSHFHRENDEKVGEKDS